MVLELGVCAANLADSITISFLALFSIFLLLIGVVYLNRFMTIFSGFMFIVLSWYLVGCINLFGYILAIFGMVMIVAGVVMEDKTL